MLTDVNAATGELFTSEMLARKGEEVELKEETKENGSQKNEEDGGGGGGEEITFEVNSVFDEVDDSKLYFSPDQGNVIFAR